MTAHLCQVLLKWQTLALCAVPKLSLTFGA
jgi:hypothetical protein